MSDCFAGETGSMEATSNGDGSGGPGPTEEKAASPAQKEPFQVRKKRSNAAFLYRFKRRKVSVTDLHIFLTG